MRLSRQTGFGIIGLFLAAGSIYGTNCGGATFRARSLNGGSSAAQSGEATTTVGAATTQTIDLPPPEPSPPSSEQDSAEAGAPPPPVAPIVPGAPPPPPPPRAPHWTKVVTGPSTSCGLVSDGRVYCWGDNRVGQLGINSSDPFRRRPALVPLSSVVDLVSNPRQSLTCAIAGSDRGIWCWGIGAGVNSNVPLQIDSARAVVSLFLVDDSICVSMGSERALYCQGTLTATGETTSTLTSHGDLDHVRDLQVSNGLVCALTDEKLWCKGSSYDLSRVGLPGGFGGSRTFQAMSAPEIPPGRDIEQLALGEQFTCLQNSLHQWLCTGQTYDARRTATTSFAATLATSPALEWKTVIPLVQDGFCRIVGDARELECTGSGDAIRYSSQPTPSILFADLTPRTTVFSGIRSLASASLSQHHGCAVSDSGSLSCWGHNKYGELGNGLRDQTEDWVRMNATLLGTSPRFRRIRLSGEASYGCAIEADGQGRVACWGYVNGGQMGRALRAGESPEQIPHWVPDVSETTDLVVTRDAACALSASGVVKCWGTQESQLIFGARGTGPIGPTQVLSGVTAIAGHNGAICGIQTDPSNPLGNSVICWGNSTFARGFDVRLGLPDTGQTAVAFPVETTRTLRIAKVSYSSLCSWNHRGEAFCWGEQPRWAEDYRSTVSLRTPPSNPTWPGIPFRSPLFDAYSEIDPSAGILACGSAPHLGGASCIVPGQFSLTGVFGLPFLTGGAPISVPGGIDRFRMGHMNSVSPQFYTCGHATLVFPPRWSCWGNLQALDSSLPALGPAPEFIEYAHAPPVRVNDFNDATDVAIGVGGACRLLAGEISCRGWNYHGQLGFAHAGSWAPIAIALPDAP